MNKRWVMVVLMAVFSLSLVVAQSTKYGSIISSTTKEQLMDFMKNEGYAVQLDEDGDILWKQDGYKTYLFLEDDNTVILFYVAFSDVDVSVEEVNAWNRDHKFSRSYIDDEDALCLESDLCLTGGVTQERPRSFIKICRDVFVSWRSEFIY
ncbi:MAG TPA: YbjN domain-containing protein [Termitinemataceae bacterium]|nr:YbjN domain-containing protein [Termitinemataceae bacterium]HOM22252.1 YbjN domain-containing protein [Termitinemataceae bacterium]HPP99326.1 YbjN domain-containing protein [Termitinemataceae bacterium]